VESYWREISPAANIDKNCPPAIVFLGEKDALIPVATAKRFQLRMKEAGVVSELELYPGQPHGFFNKNKGGEQIFLETIQKMDRFLVDQGYLVGKPTDSQLSEVAKTPSR
ncbi:MAG: alpha/beta hydrolase, partial [bacterium]